MHTGQSLTRSPSQPTRVVDRALSSGGRFSDVGTSSWSNIIGPGGAVQETRVVSTSGNERWRVFLCCLVELTSVMFIIFAFSVGGALKKVRSEMVLSQIV